MRKATSCNRRSMVRLAAFIALFCAIMLPARVFAQQDPNDQIENSAGTNYVIAFPDTTMNTYDARFKNNRFTDHAYMFIYSAVDNKCNIKGNGYSRIGMPLKAKGFTIVDLMDPSQTAASPIVTVQGQVVRNTFTVSADNPVIIYCYLVTRFGTEAWTPLATDFWGSQYYCAAIPAEVPQDVTPGGENTYQRKNKMGPSEILVTAAYDNTQLTIIPNCPLWLRPNVNNVVLNAGEAYLVQSFVDTLTQDLGSPQPDLGGSRIVATKPIGVISGNTRVQVIDEQPGLAKNSFKNMLMEALQPIEEYGTQFVYIPTQDALNITGDPNQDPTGKRSYEFVRIYAQDTGITNVYYREGGAKIIANPINTSDPSAPNFEEFRLSPTQPRVFFTDKPAQAMMHSSSVVIFGGTTGSGNYIGASYNSWSTYMVEMTPREQWCNFAPFFAHPLPAGMTHRLNIVTDTTHRFDLYTKNGSVVACTNDIPGTDLCWGWTQVQPGVDNWIDGHNGAKFYGFVYGEMMGNEQYRPGRAVKKDEGGSSLNSAGGGSPDVLHPSEYEEYLAISYGYPLAPTRIVVGPGDSLQIVKVDTCTVTTIKITDLAAKPVGLRSIQLRNPINTQIKSITPFPITGATNATVIVTPVDGLQDASATIRIVDRSGHVTTIPYVYYAERLDLTPSKELYFGQMTPGQTLDSTISASNPLGRDVVITRVRLILGNPAFTIISPDLSKGPMKLAPGAKLPIVVEAHPTIGNRSYTDTVEITLGCTVLKVPVRAETEQPEIYVDDLNFGTLAIGQSKTMRLSICNNGGGQINFNNPSADSVLEWILTNFSVSASDEAKVKAAILHRGECVDINVTFVGQKTGTYTTTTRFYGNTRYIRDTSVWRAIVTQPGPQLTGYDWGKRWVTTANSCTKDQVGEYDTTVTAYNTGDRPFTLDHMEIVGPDAKYFKLIAPMIATGQKIDTAVFETNGNRVDTVPSFQQGVAFMPDQERIYSATVRLISQDGDTVENILTGIGIESHISVSSPTDFGRLLFTGGGGVTMSDDSVLVTIKPTRPTTITGVKIIGANAGDFVIYNDESNSATGPHLYQPGESFWVHIHFQPSAPGKETATIQVLGDNSNCDTITGILTGDSYTLSSSAKGTQFPDILSCNKQSDNVSVTNTGTDPVVITSILPQSGGEFAISPASVPDTLAAGQTLTIPVEFIPSIAGTFTGRVIFEVYDVAGKYHVGTDTALIVGVAHQDTVNASIATTYHGLPGTQLLIPVTLNSNLLDEADVDNLYFSLTYQRGMMKFLEPADLNELTKNSLLSGWTVKIVDNKQNPANPREGLLSIQFTAPPGGKLSGKGDLFQMPYITFIGDTTVSGLPFFMTATGREGCATILTTPGFAKVDSVCGLNFRLIQAFGTTYALKPNSPNPFSGTTKIDFSLGLDGQTSLMVYNASGDKVATLVDGYLQPGSYSVTWDATQFPSGLYYYRLISGDWSRTNTMMLNK